MLPRSQYLQLAITIASKISTATGTRILTFKDPESPVNVSVVLVYMKRSRVSINYSDEDDHGSINTLILELRGNLF